MKLKPVDKTRCQAEKPNGASSMTIGGVPEMVRCDKKPTVTITEVEPGPDGLIGAMSLCSECLQVAQKQLPIGFFTVKTLPPTNLQDLFSVGTKQVAVSDDRITVYIDNETWHFLIFADRIKTKNVAPGVYLIDDLIQDGEFIIVKGNDKKLSK